MHLICLHNVVAGPVDAFDKKCSRISVAEFERFLNAVSKRFELVSYSEYENRLRGGVGADDCVALSFDDGFLGVHTYALPVLKAQGLDAIAFINPPFLGNPQDRIFHFLELEIAFRLTDVPELRLSFVAEPLNLTQMKPRIAAMKLVKKLLKTREDAERVMGHAEVLQCLGIDRSEILDCAASDPKFRIMEASHLNDLRASGWAIGSHAMSHRTLSMISAEDLASEIGEARAFFETAFGWRDMPFAYPYGDVVHVGPDAPRVVAREGHPIAFTTIPGPSNFAQTPHLLPRIDYKRFLRDYEAPVAA